MKFVAIRKSHIFGRIWEEGDVIESERLPSHHFALADGNGQPIIESPKVETDRRSPVTIRTDEPMSLSELSKIPQAQGGFASSLNKPMRTRSKPA